VAGGFAVGRGDGALAPLQLYVGQGAVGWGPRTRLWSRTEITLVTLQAAAADGAAAELSADVAQPAQLGGLLASALLVASLVYWCATKGRDGAADMRAARRKGTPEMVLVQQAGAVGEEVAGGGALAAGGEATPLRGGAGAREGLEAGGITSP